MQTPRHSVPYNAKIDIWSLACILFELWADGRVLFSNHSTQSLLARMSSICGPFPQWMLVKGKNVSQWFTSGGLIFETEDDRQQMGPPGTEDEHAETNIGMESDDGRIFILRPKLTTLRHRLRATGEGENRGDDYAGASGEMFLEFLTKCLQIDPRLRISTESALSHSFVAGL